LNLNLIKAANNDIPFDLVIKNVSLVNVYTKEVYASDIGIVDGHIVHATQPGEEPLFGTKEYDGKGKFAIPGLIDTHIHIESSMMNPANLAKAILPHGTTTISCDPHEIGNVMGLEGVKYIIEASKDLPLSVFTLIPSCVPSVESLETAGAAFFAKEIDEMLDWDRVIGLGEVMDFQGILSYKNRIIDILDVAKERDFFIQGHAPTLVGRKLSAYQCAGANSDHETSFAEEARYKLRAGMTLECRESSIVHDIPVLAPILKELGYPENSTLCTDDKEPDDLMREGHIDHVIRMAIKAGAEPIEMIKIATYNAARLLRLEDRGTLASGKKADILLVADLNEFIIDEVFVSGELIAKEGKLIKEFNATSHPAEKINTVILKKEIDAEDLKIKVDGTSAEVNVIAFNKEKHILTECHTETLPIIDGYVDISDRDDLCTLAVFERHGKNGNISVGFVKNFGLKEGAIASTVSHDCHNLVVVGKSYSDMEVALKKLASSGGGIVCIKDGETLAGIELPIAGLMSPDGVDTLADITHKLKTGIRSLGIDTVSPIIQVAAFSLPVIPEIRLTDMGLVNVLTQELMPTVVSVNK